ncbi:MAG: hypothetical protein R3332_05860 [Pseudohongiellaceae bacterium]|nr:hypothetical protein [Pseudohongiellaceae bacterium]
MRRFVQTLSFFLVSFSLSSFAAAQGDSCQTFRVANSEVTIDVVIDGETYPAALTMSNIPGTITLELVRKLGLNEQVDRRSTVIGDFGRPEAKRFITNLDIGLFGTTTTAKQMTIAGRGQAISLSLRLFQDLLIQMDFPNSRICFFDRDAVNMKEVHNIEMDFDPQFGVPVVKVRFNDEIDTWLQVSPGLGAGIRLDSVIAEELGLYESATSASSLLLSNTFDLMQLGPYEVGQMSAQFPRLGVNDNIKTNSQSKVGTNIKRGKESRGRIGLEILKHFVVTMDMKTGRMHIYTP